MRFSVIMASLLTDYPNSATKRDAKLIRAINTVMAQTYKDFELIVISDGCDQTNFLVKNYYSKEIESNVIKLLSVNRDQLWSNNARNKGIEEASGDYILYLDSDDIFHRDHLNIINENITDAPWYYANDSIFSHGERECVPGTYGKCGTSNIIHKRSLGLRWEKTGYGHDFHFINQLLKIDNGVRIPTAGYIVARHLPFDNITYK